MRSAQHGPQPAIRKPVRFGHVVVIHDEFDFFLPDPVFHFRDELVVRVLVLRDVGERLGQDGLHEGLGDGEAAVGDEVEVDVGVVNVPGTVGLELAEGWG